MTDLTGKTLANRYRVDAFLGRGGMADVYKVWDTHRNTTLAIKLLHSDLALDRAFLRRFKREAQTLARLQHPNIVRFYGLEQDGRQAFMVMEHVDGESLKHKVFDADGPMPLNKVMDIVRPLCQALQYAHNEGFVHADIKPGNVLIDKHGRAMLTDFGIARMTETATVTMVGAGTPAYMAPEQARLENPTPPSDIYALGIVLYEMLIGERPFNGEQAVSGNTTGEKVRWEQINLKPPSPRNLNTNLSPEIEAVVLKALSKEPDERYHSALGMMQAFEKACGEVPGTQAYDSADTLEEKITPKSKTARKKGRTPAQKPRPRYLVGIGAIVVGFTVILTSYFYWINGGSSPKDSYEETAAPTATLTQQPEISPESTAQPAIERAATPETLPSEISDDYGVEMVLVLAGEFIMGSDQGKPNEIPQRSVYLDAFYIDKYEVTNEKYDECVVSDDHCDPPIDIASDKIEEYYGNSDYRNNPVIHVMWEMAQEYCQWRGAELPTEAQWEKAARGTDGRRYPWGEGINCSKANYLDSSRSSFCYGNTRKVGSFESGKSPYGVYDMAGNVKEWVADWYEAYPGNTVEDPIYGLPDYRVLRGGSWGDSEGEQQASYRGRASKVDANKYFGFRCARSLDAESTTAIPTPSDAEFAPYGQTVSGTLKPNINKLYWFSGNREDIISVYQGGCTKLSILDADKQELKISHANPSKTFSYSLEKTGIYFVQISRCSNDSGSRNYALQLDIERTSP